MHNRVVVLSLAVAISTALAIRLAGQATAPERQLVTRAADALGGRDRVMALKTLQIVGYGELAYFNGGGNITGDPDAPQKWQKVLEYTRTIDLEHWRTRVQQRLKMDFVFASTVGQLGLNRTNETLDGDVAYNIGGGFLAAPQSGTPQPQPAGAGGGPPASCGAARPSGHDRARRARSDQQAVEPPQTGEPAARRRHRASGRHADAGGECDVESSRLGQLRRPERQPRGRHVSHRIRRLRAGERHSAADRLRHHHRLPQRRAEQALRRSQHRRCAD